MKMKTLLLMMAFMVCYGIGWASPYLTCDPYPSTVMQPTSFVGQINGVDFICPATELADGSVTMMFDLDGFWVQGDNSFSVKATTAYGESTAASDSFIAGIPTSPTGCGVVK